ncbi:MAG: Gfo/Idh/MocA family oxidoreductase [Thermomicrobiales bacterium]|nr:Gfo/Idh/MocA family oxidoreductase [Thermomicrobiales bacterium]
MAPVKLIVAGLGSFGPTWARLVHSTPDVELAAVVEPMDERRTRVAQELGLSAEQTQRDLDTALREVEADAVVVVTPPQTHLDVASKAMEAGKAVLVEKPLAATMEDARAIVTKAESTGQFLVVSQNYRYRPPMVTLRTAIERGDAGALVSIGGNCQEDMRLFYEATNFRYLMHHPYIIDMTIHHWDLLRYLTGRDIERVYAKSWRVPDSPYQQDPSCAVLLELEGDIPVYYTGSGATNTERTSWSSWWDITGDKGRLWTDGGVGDPHTDVVHRRVYGQPDEILPYEPAASRDTLGSLMAFVGAVQGGPVPAHTGADNLKSLAAVMACVASVERGAVVEVEEFL